MTGEESTLLAIPEDAVRVYLRGGPRDGRSLYLPPGQKDFYVSEDSTGKYHFTDIRHRSPTLTQAHFDWQGLGE